MRLTVRNRTEPLAIYVVEDVHSGRGSAESWRVIDSAGDSVTMQRQAPQRRLVVPAQSRDRSHDHYHQ